MAPVLSLQVVRIRVLRSRELVMGVGWLASGREHFVVN